MRPRTNTTFLLAGKGRKGLAASPGHEKVARNIVRSIREHELLGITRTPEMYSASPKTLALVYAALHEEESSP